MKNKITYEKNSPEYFMKQALMQALKGYKKEEVPVGAIIVKDKKIISKAFNLREKKQNALYHAEIIAIHKACKKLKSFRLDECEMYVTLEPCPMCSGAIINARLSKLFFGSFDKNYGCCGSKYNLTEDKAFEHVVTTKGGILESECSALIKTFFKEIRQKKKEEN